MNIVNKGKLDLFIFAGGVAFSGLYLAWQLIGLRYTNHDDIFFHLYSWVFAGDYFSFAKYVAYKQARLQAFINMPIILGINNLSDSVLFDILNIGSFCVLYLSLIWVLCIIGSLRDSLAFATVTLLLFPLHYYYTFPQGYPVMGVWSLAFALLSAGLLSSNLEQPKSWKLLLSVFLFTCSLWGPEYNFVLHPILLLIIFTTQININFRQFCKTFSPYAAGWVVSVVVYSYFSITFRSSGANEDGRVSLGLDFIAWLKTFLILEQKSFLPSALWDGIGFQSATAQGSPEIPDLLTFRNLWHGTHDWFSLTVVFVLAFIIFTMIFWQQLSIKSFRCYSIFFACLTIIPCLVVAGSTHYQLIVLNGYLQGHLVSFYSQFGLSSLVFLFLTYICNSISRRYLKLSAMVFSAIIMAGFATMTFIYNNINRQAMVANKQKWEAVRTLTTLVQSDRPDLKKRIFYAPDFWSTSGVSSIPGDSPFNGINYWSEYTKSVLNNPIQITNADGNLPDDALFAKYFSTPTGIPVVILSELLSGNQRWRITLIASRPVSGTVFFQHDGNRTRKVDLDQWKCVKQCVNTWDEFAATKPAIISFDPDDHGPIQLLAQFMLPRNSEYAYPFGWHSTHEPLAK